MKVLVRSLYFWVLVAIAVGIAYGEFAPDQAVQLKWIADLFIKAIKIIVVPVVFCTVALGVSGTGGLKRAGRLGLKSILYFEIVSTFALAIGLVIAHLIKPGARFREATGLDPSTVSTETAHEYIGQADHANWIVSLFSSGGMIPVLILGIIVGIFIGAGLRLKLEQVSHFLFKMVGWLMRAAPLAAGCAMAFTVGKYGFATLAPLLNLIFCFYLTCAIFVVGILGLIARVSGFSIFKLLKYLRAELLTVLGTSSSESVLASLIEKLERAGCDRASVGFVIPTGYAFNLDGTSIYITLAGLFIAQAMGVELSIGQQLSFIGVAILTSKGAAGVTGSGFVTLAATLAVFPIIPASGLALILGVDRFMSEARALTNMIGNAVAAVVLSRSEGQFNPAPGSPLSKN